GARPENYHRFVQRPQQGRRPLELALGLAAGRARLASRSPTTPRFLTLTKGTPLALQPRWRTAGVSRLGELPMATIPEALSIAIRHHQAGQLQAAEQVYRQILAVAPGHAPSWHLLGVIAHQVGNHQVAVAPIQHALQLDGQEPGWHSNLGEAYRALRKPAEAIGCYRRALQLRPGLAEVHYNL